MYKTDIEVIRNYVMEFISQAQQPECRLIILPGPLMIASALSLKTTNKHRIYMMIDSCLADLEDSVGNWTRVEYDISVVALVNIRPEDLVLAASDLGGQALDAPRVLSEGSFIEEFGYSTDEGQEFEVLTEEDIESLKDSLRNDYDEASAKADAAQAMMLSLSRKDKGD